MSPIDARRLARLCVPLLLAALAPGAAAETVRVAVAANFADALERLRPAFERDSGHELRASSASTGTLYAQIRRGAPFDVFLAADRERPERLVDEGFADPSSAFVYARGRLVLWSADGALVDGTPAVLHRATFRHLAVANPKTAPYGAAALDVLRELGLADELAGRLVQGENVAQAWHFVASGNAELAFVALSQVLAQDPDERGSRWLVPESLHRPIEQVAVVLKDAAERPAVRAFAAFLRSPEARRVIAGLGYAVDPAP